MAATTAGCAWPKSMAPHEPTRSSRRLPSASNRYCPAPRSMMSGSPPTERKARTGLLTPPTRICSASAKISRERRRPCCGEGCVELIGLCSTIRSFQPAGGIFGMIRQYEIRAGAPDTGENFEHHTLFVEPAVFRSGFHHGIFAADVVSGHRHAKFVFNLSNNIDIRQRRLDNHHVGAFFEIERDLSQSLARIAGIHLIAAAFAKLRRGIRRFAKLPVESGAILRRVERIGTSGKPPPSSFRR